MDEGVLAGLSATPREAAAIQRELTGRVVLRPPPGFAPGRFGGADLSADRRSTRGWAGLTVLELDPLRTVDSAVVSATLPFPYVPGMLSFRELPPLAEAWRGLRIRPDVLLFDGHGIAHPRRFGLACHGGLLLGVPSLGCAKTLLVGEHGPLALERGATAPLIHRREVVGAAVRTRTGVRPVYVSPGHLIDLPAAIEIVLRLSPRFREPETTRTAHRLVNEARRA